MRFQSSKEVSGQTSAFPWQETRAQNRRKPSDTDDNVHWTSHLPGESPLAGTSSVCGPTRGFVMSSWFIKGRRTATFSEVLFHVGNGQSGCVNHQSDGPSESWACNGLPVGRRPRVSRVHRNETALLAASTLCNGPRLLVSEPCRDWKGVFHLRVHFHGCCKCGTRGRKTPRNLSEADPINLLVKFSGS